MLLCKFEGKINYGIYKKKFADLYFKILLPGGIVLYGMYLVVVSFLVPKEAEKMIVELKTKKYGSNPPIRLKLPERLCLFLSDHPNI